MAEYVKHRLVNEPTDWHRYFQCSEIDSTSSQWKLINLMRQIGIKKKGATEVAVNSRLVEHADMKDAAAQLTQVADDVRHHVLGASRLERLRIQQAAEVSRELPTIQSR